MLDDFSLLQGETRALVGDAQQETYAAALGDTPVPAVGDSDASDKGSSGALGANQGPRTRGVDVTSAKEVDRSMLPGRVGIAPDDVGSSGKRLQVGARASTAVVPTTPQETGRTNKGGF